MPPVPAASRDPARAGRALPAVALATFALLSLAACGGGSGTAPAGAAATAGAAAPQSPATGGSGGATSGDLAIAEQLYAGIVRVPPGFFVDAPPAGVTGSVLTTHLKNSDVDAGATGARFELCSDDPAQVLAWSELRATYQGAYSDLVETNDGPRALELVRVPRADRNARLRHRVFHCRYLDRSGTDLALESGAAGTLRAAPLDAAALRELAEYLWQFTLFNNADHVVLQSVASTAGSTGALAHSIDMARLVRAGVSGDCDRIEILRWTHAVDLASGTLTRRLDALRAFRARRDNGVVSVCSG